MSILAFSKYLHGLDSFIRHKIVADIIINSPCDSKNILDVGGETRITTNQLGFYLPKRRVLTTNIISQTGIQVKGVELPFEDKSFDAVVSIDTLEHIPKEDRDKAIREYYRLARKEIILTGPIDNDFQRESENRINDRHKALFGIDHHYVIEHLKFGDPTEEDLKRWIEGHKTSIKYLDDNRIAEKHIIIAFSFCPKIKIVNKLFKVFYTAYTIKDYQSLEFLTSPQPTTRRFLVHIII